MIYKGLFARMADQVVRGIGVKHTSLQGLNTKVFTAGDRRIVAIQQNTRTSSEWAKLARDGHKVVQFKDAETNKYIGVSVDGHVKEY